MRYATPAKLLLALALAAGVVAQAQEGEFSFTEDFNYAEQGGAAADSERSLLDAIDEIESRDGAYSEQLSEQLLSLGLSLQEQQRHSEAVDVFKRGVHLARVNSGLYCPDQIPLLQGQIQSLIALGQYAAVDERQEYLYRVQLRSLESGEARANALLRQAAWQFNAYRLGLGAGGPGRLMTMWELYRFALQDIIDSEGETSPKLLSPLQGMLRTQYLISTYRDTSGNPGNSFDGSYSNPDLSRFYAYRSRNYDQGKSVILAIYDVQKANYGADSSAAIDSLVALGDWVLWHGKRDESIETYRHVLTELALSDDAKEQETRLFAEPVPLPDLDGLRGLPPVVDAGEGDILLEFGVDSRGKVVDLVRLDENEGNDAAAGRLIRELRNTQFRPRFDAGAPAGTDKLVRAYDIKP